MAPTDRKRLAQCLLAAAEVYGREVSASVTAIWWAALQGHDIEAVEVAFQRHMMNPDTGQFMPKPADIVRMLAGTTQDSAMVAWAKVDKAMRTVGTYQSVVFDDPLAMRVLQDMGGWIALGTKDGDEWPFVANEFRTRYQGYKQRGETPEYPTRLVGISDADRVRKGLALGDVTLIGDSVKAMHVANGGTDRAAIGVQRAPLDQAVAKVLKLVDGRKQ
jgi:hypothetical protein